VWSDTNTFKYSCDAADVNASQIDVDIQVSSAEDDTGNAMVLDMATGQNKFSVNMTI